MRATIIRNGEFVVDQMADPKPGPGQVLVRNLACGICGSDLHLFGMLKAAAQAAQPNTPSTDFVLGHEYCSEIVAFGPDTKQQMNVGQRVCSIPFLKTEEGQDGIGVSPTIHGAYAEYMVLSEEYLLPVPEHLSSEAAALTEPLAVGIHAVNKANLQGDETALVIGCGPIGLAVIAALKMRGINTVLASDPSPSRRERAIMVGANSVIDPNAESPFDLLNKTLESQPAQTVVFECVGAVGLLQQICSQTPAHSRVIVAGLCTAQDSFMPIEALRKELSIQYVFYYEAPEFEDALNALADGTIRWQAWLSAKVGLNGIADAFELLQNPETHAKIIIEPWRDGAVEPLAS
ncbi:MAG: zinc-binding dehydrogenase [Pseudomonadales bacterium]|nr:zinc-binding dehydrogenase [Pseudomonadales bacterium]